MLIKPFNPLFNIDRRPTSFVGSIDHKKNKIQFSQDTIHFTGKKDLLSQPKEKIFQQIQKSINKRNILGEGCEAAVYKIPNTNYCIRKPLRLKALNNELDLKLTVKDKINHVVAKLGDNCRIMKIIDGIPIASLNEKNSEKLEYIEELIENFPVESYSKFIKQITYAYKNGMVFDCFWTNVLINSEKQTFVAIDFYPIDQYDCPDICYPTPLKSIFASVMNLRASQEQMQICTKKLLKAGLEEMKPNYKPYIKPEEIDFTEFLEWLISRKNVNLTQENFKVLKEKFDRITVLKTNELKGKAIKKELASEINLTNKIIDQVL